MPPESPEDPAEEDRLRALFAGLRARVFGGTQAMTLRVMQAVREQLRGQPAESLLTSVLVELTNVVTGLVDPSSRQLGPPAGARGGDEPSPAPSSVPPPPSSKET